MPCDNCKHEENIKQMQSDIRSLFGKNNNFEIKLTELSLDSKYTRETLTEVKIIVEEMAKNPQKRWNLIINTAITAVVSTGLGFVIAFIVKG